MSSSFLDPTFIGLREFMLTTGSELDDDLTSNEPVIGDFVFIASESLTPLPWASVVSNPARRERKLSGTTREIYFSLTDAYDPAETTDELVNLSTTDERTAVPGIMIPGQTYYVHAYKSSGSHFATGGPITTKNYPTSMPAPINSASTTWPNDPYYTADNTHSLGAYYWGMYLRQKPKGEPHPIELRRGEISYIPMRLIYPGEDDNRAGTLFGGTCSVPPTDIGIGIKYSSEASGSPFYDWNRGTAGAIPNTVVFTYGTSLSSTHENYVRDLMWKPDWSRAASGVIFSAQYCDVSSPPAHHPRFAEITFVGE